MNDVRLIIRDESQDLHLDHGKDFAEFVVAALSAKPETIDELDVALERFVSPEEWTNFCGAAKGIGDESRELGIVVVDLAARLVASDWLFTAESEQPAAADPDEELFDEDARLLKRLSPDWLVSSDAQEWRALAAARRHERQANPPLDARSVLYGQPLLEFIGRECWQSFRDRPPLPDRDNEDDGELFGDDDGSDEAAYRELYNEEHDLIRAIHVRWMMTPRDDLRGKTPREVMHAKRACLSWDTQDRESQWSHEDRCPRGLNPDSAAYRFAGFGTHEMVVYYDMLRHLFWTCRHDVADFVQLRDADGLTAGDFLTIEVPQLEQQREDWLDAPDPEFHGRAPRSIIHKERARIPEGMDGSEAIIDHDCPICQMQAELPGPVFWGLDGCSMDDDFAFSMFHDTLEEWEAEQRRHEEFNRRFKAKEAECKRLGVKYPGSGYGDPDYVWKRSFSADESADGPALMRLFAVGSHLTELIVDLKEVGTGDVGDTTDVSTDGPSTSRAMIDRLSRDFGNLRELAQSRDFTAAEALFEPVLDRFCDSLAEVAAAHPKLEPKCSALQTKLSRFLEPATDAPYDPGDDDIPF